MFLLFSPALLGHPSWGILIDQAGNILFSDLEHIWQISPDGQLSKRLPNVHTELITQRLKEQKPKNPPLKEARFNLFYGMTVLGDQIFQI